MKTLKNVTLGLLLSLGLFQTQANAGVIVGLLSGSATAGVIVGGVTGALGTLAFEALALFDPNPTFGVSLLKGIGVGVILEQKFDSESSLSQSNQRSLLLCR